MTDNSVLTPLGKDGRIVIPAKIRKLLGLKAGAKLRLTLSDEGVMIQDPKKAWQDLQDMVAPYRAKPGEPLVSDQLIAERRAEAKREGY